MEPIKKSDIVFHTLSKLYFRCENPKMERWMNMNPFYIKSVLPEGYIIDGRKTIKKEKQQDGE